MIPSTSFFQSLWLFLHIIGFGMFATILLGNVIAEKHLRAAKDWPTRMRMGMFMKQLGMLSPVATVLMLATGIANMVTFGFTMSQAFGPAAAWLGVKIIFFFVAVINGTIIGITMGKKREAIGLAVKNGGPAEQGEAAFKATFGKMNLFYAVQAVLFTVILVMVMFRPF